MMRKLVLLCCASLLLYSCGEEEQTHLPRQKMQQVLLDVYLAESYSTLLHKDSNSRRNERNLDSLANFYLSIFRHHNISPEEFAQSFEWYKHNPEELDSLYRALMPEISKLEGLYN